MTLPFSIDKIFTIHSQSQFDEALLLILQHQLTHNSVYAEFCKTISGRSRKAELIYLPVSFFKTHEVYTGGDVSEVFLSSSTTGSVPSKHMVSDIDLYKRSLLESFSFAYGDPEDFNYLCLLPNYLERGNSSLVYMMNELIGKSKRQHNGFFLNDYSELAEKLNLVNQSGEKCIFIGVSYALQEMAELFPAKLNENIIVMETGGTKGKSKSIIKEELHEMLCKAFNKKKIHSEYGMTEMLSQCYSKGDGLYRCPPWVKVLARDIYDPLSILEPGQSGALNVIDLANVNSCPFIATDDTGTVYEDGSFRITGRMQSSEVRGCNLLS